ncbi:hypothetical protein P7K49_009473 [Saguinus oedipus]|uniref:Uncharacterized protein n=1 Tax=Saguinus oedipus TaxID=9490 RepID=A0ABQ9VK41_SAGOE|nr:hypothetical protein P7K49_009473 [Saguinus oedipus]
MTKAPPLPPSRLGLPPDSGTDAWSGLGATVTAAIFGEPPPPPRRNRETETGGDPKRARNKARGGQREAAGERNRPEGARQRARDTERREGEKKGESERGASERASEDTAEPGRAEPPPPLPTCPARDPRGAGGWASSRPAVAAAAPTLLAAQPPLSFPPPSSRLLAARVGFGAPAPPAPSRRASARLRVGQQRGCALRAGPGRAASPPARASDCCPGRRPREPPQAARARDQTSLGSDNVPVQEPARLVPGPDPSRSAPPWLEGTGSAAGAAQRPAGYIVFLRWTGEVAADLPSPRDSGRARLVPAARWREAGGGEGGPRSFQSPVEVKEKEEVKEEESDGLRCRLEKRRREEREREGGWPGAFPGRWERPAGCPGDGGQIEGESGP